MKNYKERLQLLERLNPNLYDNKSEPHSLYLISDKEGKFVRTTKPSKAAVEMGIEPERYLKAKVRKQSIVFNKPIAYNIFEKSNPIVFEQLLDIIINKEYDIVKFEDGINTVKIHKPIHGIIKTINVPIYQATRVTDKGEREPLTATCRTTDPDGKYINKPVHLDYFKFFATEDDIEIIHHKAVAIFEKQTEPFIVEKIPKPVIMDTIKFSELQPDDIVTIKKRADRYFKIVEVSSTLHEENEDAKAFYMNNRMYHMRGEQVTISAVLDINDEFGYNFFSSWSWPFEAIDRSKPVIRNGEKYRLIP